MRLQYGIITLIIITAAALTTFYNIQLMYSKHTWKKYFKKSLNFFDNYQHKIDTLQNIIFPTVPFYQILLIFMNILLKSKKRKLHVQQKFNFQIFIHIIFQFSLGAKLIFN